MFHDLQVITLGIWESVDWAASPGFSAAVGKTAFAAGVATPSSAFFALGGLRATYALKDATPVFSSTNASGTLLASSQLTADFSNSYVDVNLDVRMPTAIDYNFRGGVTTFGNSLFTGSLAISGPGCEGAGGFCAGGVATGRFIGATAQNALLSFGGFSIANGVIAGAATFSSTSQVDIPTTDKLTDLAVSLADGSGVIPRAVLMSGNSAITPVFYGQKMNSVTDNAATTSSVFTNTAPLTGAFGAIGTVSDAGFIGWGNWVAGAGGIKPINSIASSSMLDSVHYIVGRPASNLPSTGYGTYLVVGNTAPTATLGGVTQTGQLIKASLDADFSTGAVLTSIDTQFGTTAVSMLNQSATFSRGSASFSSASSVSGSTVSGFFTGDQASRAGLVYSIPSDIGNVTGAAAFQRGGLTAPPLAPALP
jgi:hypothetical protein